MRLEAFGLLPVLAVVALALVANASERSSGIEQSDHVESSNETSLYIADGNAGDEVTDVALGDSRTSVGGEKMRDEQRVPEHMSVLWCPEILHVDDGHFCGWMMFLTDQHFLASSDAMYVVQSQLNKNLAPPAGWKRRPPNPLNIKEPNSLSKSEDDWKYRFLFRKTIKHGMALYRLRSEQFLGPHHKAFPMTLETEKDFTHEYNLFPNEQPAKIPCYVIVYGSDKDDQGEKLNIRRLRRVKVKLINDCDQGRCRFDLDDKDAIELCGRNTDIGAPVSCRERTITHLVTSVLYKEGRLCSHRFDAMDLVRYGSHLRVMNDTDLESQLNDKFTSSPPPRVKNDRFSPGHIMSPAGFG